ncbi:MAG: PPOX class F420-dependent oxidoreductase [Acidimicrobiales bacterium]
MALDPADLPEGVQLFLEERRLGTLTTLRPDGSPHVVAIAFTWDPDARLVRVITFASSRKALNLRANPGSRAAVCQVDGGRWVTLEGRATVTDEPERVAEGVRRYTERYQPPKARDDRVVIEIEVDRVLGRA